MGFYGNITNTARTQFQFDRTYPNRYSMELSMATDGVYAGRYVLIEYDQNPGGTEFYQEIFREKSTNRFYLNYNSEKEVEVLYPRDVKKDEIVRVYEEQRTDITKPDTRKIYFYKCINESLESEEIAIFELVSSADISYTQNYSIDLSKYGNASRGWDSTVWQKVYTQGVEKYVMIAELNTVVPSFDLVEDAPTMTPLTPHFDSESNNVYYKLHWQPQWGLRVAKQEDNEPSDCTTIWVREDYDSTTDEKTKKYYDYESNEWIEYENFDDVIKNSNARLPAAIYYNVAAFNPQVGEKVINKHAIETNNTNYFTILPTGQSGKKYNSHDGTGDPVEAKDIQEMRINLPAIGNMMSDAWDIIHGPNRDDSMAEFELDEDGNRKLDENDNPIRIDSLQGRLNSIAAIHGNEIPVKRNSDGRLVGTKINGDNNRIASEIPEILAEALSTSLDEDDAWIYTKIDSNAITDEHNNGIAIHHTYHPTDSSTSSVDKNNGNVGKSDKYKEDHLVTKNLTAEKDKINLYVPYVDAAGHVVGENIETITLPYSYKTFKTDGLNEENNKDIYTKITKDENGANTSEAEAKESNTVANNTQDVMSIDPGNKWIQTKFEDDELIIAHEIHAVNEVAKSSDLNENKNDEITIQDIKFDIAGHVIENQPHTYTLPYGFKTIKTNGTTAEVTNMDTAIVDIVADTTQDVLTINSHNKWIRLANNPGANSITIAHEVNTINTDDEKATNINTENGAKDEKNINIPDWSYDAAGHIVEKHDHFYTLPYGFKTITTNGSNSSSISDMSIATENIVADNTQDTLAINSHNKWIKIANNASADSITFAHEVNFIDTTEKETTNINEGSDAESRNNINIPDWTFDAAGHITGKHSHKYTLPYGFKTIKTNGTTDETTDMTPATADIIADQTQDILTINSHNKWIKIANDTNADSITFAHTVNEIDIDGDKFSNANEELNAENENNINIPDWTYDAAGHITSKKNHYYTLPYGFKTVKTNGTIDNINQLESVSGSLIADSTQDSFTLNTGNKWIRTAIDENNDILTIAHETHSLTTNAKDVTDLNNIDTFTVQDTQYDEAGHITHNQPHAYKLPFNFKTLSVGKLTDTTTEGESKEGKIIADNSIAEFTVSSNNRWITMKADTNNSILSIGHAYAGNASQYDKQSADQSPNFGASFNIPYNSFDQAGHLSSVSNVKVTLPKALDDNAIVEKTNASVITGIGTNDAGSIITSSADVGTLVLEGYQGIEQGDLVDSDSINSAFAKLQNQIHAEVTDRNSTISTAIGNVTDGSTETIASLLTKLETLQSQYNDLLARVEALEANHPAEEEPTT